MLNVLFVNIARMLRIVVGTYNRDFSTTLELTIRMTSPTLLKWMTKKDRSFDFITLRLRFSLWDSFFSITNFIIYSLFPIGNTEYFSLLKIFYKFKKNYKILILILNYIDTIKNFC